MLIYLGFYQTEEMDWFLSCCPDGFVEYKFSTNGRENYPAERRFPVKRQKTDAIPILPVIVTSVDVHWLPGTNRKTIFEV